MNRRDLLKYLLATPAAALVDYEKLLWVPGEKTIFLPSQTLDLHLSQAQIDFWDLSRQNIQQREVPPDYLHASWR